MKYIGPDHLGILHRQFPIKLALKYFPAGAALGVLVDNTFGENIQRIKQFPYAMLQVHLLNNTAVRNNKLYKTELLYPYNGGSSGSMLAELDRDAKERRAKLYNIIDKQLKRIEIFKDRPLLVSGLLEHNLSREGAIKVARHICDAGFTPVDNPMTRNYAKIENVLYETHGNNKSKVNIVSSDGIDLSDINFYGDDPFQKAADTFEKYWMLGDNLNFSGGKEFIPPRDRAVKLTEYEFLYRLQMMRDAPRSPNVTGYRALNSQQIWKPMAENYKKPNDPRQGLPVFITAEAVSKGFNVLSLEGKRIGRLPYYGTIDTRHRYYLGGTGDDHFSLWAKNGKREWVLLEAGSKKYKANIFRRTGVQR